MRYFSVGRYFHHRPCQVRQRGAAEPQRHGAARAATLERADEVRSRGQKRGKHADAAVAATTTAAAVAAGVAAYSRPHTWDYCLKRVYPTPLDWLGRYT